MQSDIVLRPCLGALALLVLVASTSLGCKAGEKATSDAPAQAAGDSVTKESIVGSWKVTGGDATSKGVVYKFGDDGTVTLSGMTKCQYEVSPGLVAMTCGSVKLEYKAALQGDGALELSGSGNTSGHLIMTKS